MKNIIIFFICASSIIMVFYVGSYLSLKSYSFTDTSQKQNGSEGYSLFSYSYENDDTQYAHATSCYIARNLYYKGSFPVTFDKSLYWPLEKIELIFRNKKTTTISNKEIKALSEDSGQNNIILFEMHH